MCIRDSAKAAKALKLPSWQPVVLRAGSKLGRGNEQRVVLEGGSIDTNGQGILLTTEECMLSEVQQRNPGLSRVQMEQVFSDYLGIDQVLWLGRGIAGEDVYKRQGKTLRWLRKHLPGSAKLNSAIFANCEWGMKSC